MNDNKHETKQNASHTPGPWEYVTSTRKDGSVHHIAGHNRHGDTLAVICELVTPWANLIAAAPALLAFALNIMAACSVQANLNSTASEADRSRFISDVFRLWNTDGIAATDKATDIVVAA